MTGIAARWRRRGGGPTVLIVPSTPPPRLLDLVRAAVRLRHLSRRAEKAYVGWIRRFILFHAKRHPIDMGPAEITRFLSALATERNVSASTQNQALAALLFRYRNVLDRDVPWLDELVRARRPARLPVVLSPDEVGVVIRELQGVHRLMADVPLRRRPPPARMRPAPGEGRRLRPQSDHRSRWEGRSGSTHRSPRNRAGPARAAPAARAPSARGRSPRRRRLGRAAHGAGGNVSPCRPGMGVAVGLSGDSRLPSS